MTVDVRKGMPDPHLDREAFSARFFEQFSDPKFEAIRAELKSACDIAWDAYQAKRKSPRTRKAGAEFADPDYDLSLDWIAARDGIGAAQARHDDAAAPSRILIINGCPRSEHTCPGEMSKTWRLVETARQALAAIPDTECEVLDLSRLSKPDASVPINDEVGKCWRCAARVSCAN